MVYILKLYTRNKGGKMSSDLTKEDIFRMFAETDREIKERFKKLLRLISDWRVIVMARRWKFLPNDTTTGMQRLLLVDF